MIIAAASIDDIIAISAFSIVMSVSFVDESKSLLVVLLHAPTEIAVGFLAAIIAGVIMWYIPPPDKHELDKRGHPLLRTENHTTARFLILFGTGIMFMFGFQRMELAGAGALGCLSVSFVTGLGWDIDTKRPVGEAFGHAWNSLMPLLFGLIGSEIKLNVIEVDNIWKAVLVLIGGLLVRVCVSFLTVMGVGLNVKEQLFVAIAWIPKATVQAAISGIPLDQAMRTGDATKIQRGKYILTIAVLAILITAPIGALGIRLTGKRLLQLPKRLLTRRSFRRRSSIQKSDGYPRPLIAMNLIPADSSADPDEAKTEIQPGMKLDPSADTMITIDETNSNITSNGTVVVIQPGLPASKNSASPETETEKDDPQCDQQQNSVDV